jgi:hypothetical protein
LADLSGSIVSVTQNFEIESANDTAFRAYTEQTIGKRWIEGPSRWFLDMNLIKRIRIDESKSSRCAWMPSTF